jgi:hypothetical protein
MHHHPSSSIINVLGGHCFLNHSSITTINSTYLPAFSRQ